jgi:hypothetical protein
MEKKTVIFENKLFFNGADYDISDKAGHLSDLLNELRDKDKVKITVEYEDDYSKETFSKLVNDIKTYLGSAVKYYNDDEHKEAYKCIKVGFNKLKDLYDSINEYY